MTRVKTSQVEMIEVPEAKNELGIDDCECEMELWEREEERSEKGREG